MGTQFHLKQNFSPEQCHGGPISARSNAMGAQFLLDQNFSPEQCMTCLNGVMGSMVSMGNSCASLYGKAKFQPGAMPWGPNST